MDMTTAQPGRSSVHPLYLTSDTSTGEGNETANNNEAVLKELNNQSVRQLAPVIGYLILLMVIGIPGNSITCYIYKKKMKKTTTNRFILWLAVLDLVACLLGIPFEMCHLLLRYLFDQPAICKIFSSILYFTSFTSFVTVLSIAIDRYYKICKPLTQSPTRKYRYFIVGSAIIGIISSSPVFVFYGTSKIETSYPGIAGHSCTIVPSFQHSALTLAYFGYVLCVNVVGIVGLLILYTYIMLQIQKWSRKTTEDDERSKASDKDNKDVDKIHRSTVTCFAITIVFVIAFLPCTISHMIRTAKTGFERGLSDSSFATFTFFRCCYLLSNVLNPVLYGFLNPVFRRHCASMLKCLD